MNPMIENYTSVQAAIEATARQLRELLTPLNQQSEPVLLLLSGGSNIQVAELAQEQINHPNITSYVLDERFSADPQLNNSLQLQAKGINVSPLVPREGEKLTGMAQRFNDELENWLDQHRQGKVVATWGMGPDGHVAGISPMTDEEKRFQETFINTNSLVVGYEGNLEPPQRITTTPWFIQQYVHHLIGLVTGEAKQVAFTSFMEKSTPLHHHPVQLFHSARGQVTIHTDF